MADSINGDAADITAALLQVVDGQKVGMIRSVRAGITAIRKSIPDEDIEAAIGSGSIPDSWGELLEEGYAGLIEKRFRPRWKKAADASAGLVQDGAEELDYEHDWDGLEERLEADKDARADELLEGFVSRQLEASRLVLRGLGDETPVGTELLSEALRYSIGLTVQQARALVGYVRALTEDEGDEEKGAPMSRRRMLAFRRKSVMSMLRRRAGMMVGQRSRLMAVTELVASFALGAVSAVKDLVAGVGMDTAPTRVWVASGGGKTGPCPVCVELDGAEAPLGGRYPSGRKGPPAHGNCYCTERFVVKD